MYFVKAALHRAGADQARSEGKEAIVVVGKEADFEGVFVTIAISGKESEVSEG